MKIKFSKKLRQLGTALLVALVLGSILCVSVTGYLSVSEQQNFLSARSQTWNLAIVVTEAGVEEGLEHLNVNTTTNLSADGWSFDGTWYSHANTLPNGDSYKVSITITNPAIPQLICSSTVASTTWLTQNSSPFFVGVINGQTTIAPTTVQRAVKVVCSKANLFTAALVVKHGIDLKGNGVYTDSYDSTDPAKSTGGKYDSSKYSGDRGDVATNGGVNDSVGVQNANIFGHVHTGANCPVSTGPNGAVGSHAWQALNSGLEPNWVSQDANFTFPDTTLPNTAGYLTPTGPFTNVATVYTYVTNSVGPTNTYPNPPPPWGGVSTNTTFSTNSIYSSPPPPAATNTVSFTTVTNYPSPLPPGLVTNTLTATTATYPAAGTYFGGVTTNTVITNSASYPSAGSYVGTISTNTTLTTNATYPAAGIYIGAVSTNTTPQTTASYPSAGSYIGSITTNLTSQTSGSYPSPGTFFPPVGTNTTFTTSTTYPAAGTYVGSVTTRVVSNGPPAGRGTFYDFNQITGYTYNVINNYSYAVFASYSYNKVSGYAYQIVSSFTFSYHTYTSPNYTYSYPNYTYNYNRFTTNTTYVTNKYDYVLHGNNSYVTYGGFSGKTVYIEGANVTLVMPNGMDGTEGFTWASGATLLVYAGGTSIGVAGNGYINPNGTAGSLIIYAAPTVTSFTLAGNGQFTGVLVAPNADLNLKGGGSSNEDFCGSIMANSAGMNGHFSFHYDESLNSTPSNSRYLISSWDEIDPEGRALIGHNAV